MKDNSEEAYQKQRTHLFQHLDAFLLDHYGERCPERNGGCNTCAAWSVRDALDGTLLDWDC